LYPINTFDGTNYHYLSSTAGSYSYTNHTNSYGSENKYTGTKWNNGYVFWAEEAGSTSPADVNWGGEKNRFLVRCLRNLGFDSDIDGQIGNSVQMYSQFSTKEISSNGNNSSTIGVVTSSFLNTRSLREKVFAEGEQYGIGDETYSNNKPHVEFFIAPSNSSKMYYSDLKSNVENGELDKVCPEGWRVPYGKELSIMFAVIPSDINTSYNGAFIDWSNPSNSNSGGGVNNHWLSSTYSRFGKYGDKTWNATRDAIVATGNGIMTVGSGDKSYVRCVKDNTDYKPQTPVMTINDGGNAF
jgi:hypothetical protein